MQKWNQINKRLKTIIAEGIDISFNHSPVVKKTFRGSFPIGFFHIKFNGQIIWEYPKNNSYHNFRFSDKYWPYNEWNGYWKGGQKTFTPYCKNSQYASPQNIIAGYLDMPKDKLLEFDEPTGIKYILWACDKRIGKNRLSEMQFTEFAVPIIKTRVPEYNLETCLGNSMTLVYSDDEISIFGKSKWQFESTFTDRWSNVHRFIVTDNPSYALSKHAININFNGIINKKFYWHDSYSVFSRNEFQITTEFEQKLMSALKSPSKNLDNATVWEELIQLENKYSKADPMLLDYPLFEKIEIR